MVSAITSTPPLPLTAAAVATVAGDNISQPQPQWVVTQHIQHTTTTNSTTEYNTPAAPQWQPLSLHSMQVVFSIFHLFIIIYVVPTYIVSS